MALCLTRAVGILILVLGVKGTFAPAGFVETVTFFQSPPMLYVAAVVRVAVGLVLIVAAPASRMPVLVRALGVLIAVGGLLAANPLIPRVFGIVALGLGVMVLYAARRPTKKM